MEGYFYNQARVTDFPRSDRRPGEMDRWYKNERCDYCERPAKKPRFGWRGIAKKGGRASAPRGWSLSGGD